MNHRVTIHVWLGALVLLHILGATSSASAQEGSLSKDMIGQIQATFQMDASTRAVYNAVTNNGVKQLALNRDILRRHNEFFSDKIKVKGITNQKSSGRCWLFAGLNSLRPAVIAKHQLDRFEFSQNYLAFWDKMEKANTFLQYMIDFRDRDLMDREMVMLLRGEPGDGGYFESFADLVNKYGVVPKEAMPETNSSGSTGMMNRLFFSYVNTDICVLKKIAIRSIQDGTPLAFAADVSPDQSGEHGIMAEGLYDYESIFGLNIHLTKAERALYRSSVRNHLMTLVGVDLKEGKPIKWRVENSWGSSKGSKGYWTMYDNWFDLHVYNIIANKKYVPKRILKIRDEPAIVLPPWDPML